MPISIETEPMNIAFETISIEFVRVSIETEPMNVAFEPISIALIIVSIETEPMKVAFGTISIAQMQKNLFSSTQNGRCSIGTLNHLALKHTLT